MLYQIADLYINIDCKDQYTKRLCSTYQIEAEQSDKVEIQVTVTDEDVKVEESKADGDYSFGYLESLALYRKLCEKALFFDVLLFHSSAVMVDNEVYLFTAPSGTGKSTHTRLWREYFGEKAVMINDDKPLLKFMEDGIYACGTPWAGKHRLSNNIMGRIKGICILERSMNNRIERIDKREAFPMILNQTYRPDDTLLMKKTLDLVMKIFEQIPIYRLECNISMEAVETAYEGMKVEQE